jgi:urea transport system permease protein
VFFGLGGCVMAVHLKLADAWPGNLPDFMQV